MPPRISVSTRRVRTAHRQLHRTNAVPLATVPTLVVPLKSTLGPDIESRYKAVQDTKVRCSDPHHARDLTSSV